MPTYEYRCLKCDKVFEEFQSISAEPLTDCKFCDGKVKRLISAGTGLIFKGSGFYITDYKKDSYKQAESKEKASSISTAKPDKKTDTKKPADTQSKTKAAS